MRPPLWRGVVMARLIGDIVCPVLEKMEGINLLLNEDDLTDIQAVIDGPPSTPYHGGQFKVKLALSKDFPASAPKGRC